MPLPARRGSQAPQAHSLAEANVMLNELHNRLSIIEREFARLATIVNQIDLSVSEDVDMKKPGSIWGV